MDVQNIQIQIQNSNPTPNVLTNYEKKNPKFQCRESYEYQSNAI